jgi:hypothetical protein
MKKILTVMFMLFMLTAVNAQIKVVDSEKELRESYKKVQDSGKRLVIYIPNLSDIYRCDDCIKIESTLFKNSDFLSKVNNDFSLIILDVKKDPILYDKYSLAYNFWIDLGLRFLFLDRLDTEDKYLAITYANTSGPLNLEYLNFALNNADENKQWLESIYATREFDISSTDEISSIRSKARNIYIKNIQLVTSYLVRRLNPETYLKEGFEQYVAMEPENSDQKYFQFLLNNQDRILDNHGEEVLNMFKYRVYQTFADESINSMDEELFVKVRDKLLPDLKMSDEDMKSVLYHLELNYYVKKGDHNKVLELFNARYDNGSLNPRNEIETYWIHLTDELDVTLYNSILEKYQNYQPSEGEYLTYFMVLSKLYEITGNKANAEAVSNGYIEFLEENSSRESFNFHEEVNKLEKLPYVTKTVKNQIIDFVLTNDNLEKDYKYYEFLYQNYKAIGDDLNTEKYSKLLLESIRLQKIKARGGR